MPEDLPPNSASGQQPTAGSDAAGGEATSRRLSSAESGASSSAFAKISAKFDEGLLGGYASTGRASLEKLHGDIIAMAAAREKLLGSSAFSVSDAKQAQSKAADRVDKILADAHHADLLAKHFSAAAVPPLKLAIEPIDVRPLRVPRPEETPVGKATIQSQAQLAQVVELTAKLVADMSQMSQTLVTQVLPDLNRKAEEDRASALVSIDQAGRSLGWAKWALIATVALTALQFVMGWAYKRDADV